MKICKGGENPMKLKLANRKKVFSVLFGIFFTLLICLGVFFDYGEKKEIMFCDEVYTYTVANVHGVHLAVRDNKWYTAPEMDKRFSSLEGYNFKAVREGTGNDVSPPIYYCSFKGMAATFPTSTSKWIGFGTNLVFFIPFLILLYCVIWKITDKHWIAAAFTVLLGVNPGMQGIALLIRMYMLFVLCMLVFYMQMEQIHKKRGTLRRYIGISVTTFIGFMTHYYFAMYVALFSVFYVIDQMIEKRWKAIAAYLGAMVTAVIAATIYFPQWIGHFFKSDKANTSLDTLSNWTSIGKEMIEAMEDVGELLSPSNAIIFWAIILVISILFFTMKDAELKNIKKYCAMHLMTQMTYYAVVAHMMPSHEPRYYWAIAILQGITGIYMLAHILKHYRLLERKTVISATLFVTIIYTAMFPARVEDVPYNGVKYKEGRLIMEQYSQTPWLIYGEKDWILHCTAFDFLIPERLQFITEASTLVYDEVLQTNDEIVLYVRSEEHLKATMKQLEEISGSGYTAEKLADRSFNTAYLVTLDK